MSRAFTREDLDVAHVLQPVMDWLEAHGIDPRTIRPEVIVSDDRATVAGWRYLLDANGRQQLDPLHPNEPLVDSFAVHATGPDDLCPVPCAPSS